MRRRRRRREKNKKWARQTDDKKPGDRIDKSKNENNSGTESNPEPEKRNAAKRDNAGAVCNSGMGMFFYVIHF